MGLAQLDAFGKSIAGAHEKTGAGAVVSLLAYLFMAYLFAAEFMAYRHVEQVEKLALFRGEAGGMVGLSLDVSFPSLPCEKVALTYRNMHSPKVLEDVTTSFAKTGLAKGAGCRVQGAMQVPQIAGLLEIEPAEASSKYKGHAAVELGDLLGFNASHKIHALSFGAERGGNPLDGQTAAREKGAWQYLYHVKVVPTTFAALGRAPVAANQYSATYYFKQAVEEEGEAGWNPFQAVEIPGFFLKFEFSAIELRKREEKRSLLQFLTSVSAIVGGVYAAFGMLDLAVHGVMQAKKID